MFRKFSERSTIHGVRYVGQRNNLLDLIFWAAVIIISCFICICLIFNTFTSWDNEPIKIIHGNMFDINDIEAPAITICPVTPIKNYEIVNLYTKLHKIFKDEECQFDSDE